MSVREAIALVLASSAAVVVQARELVGPVPSPAVARFVDSLDALRDSLPRASARLALVVERPGSPADGYRCQLAQYALAPHIVSCVRPGETSDVSFLIVGGVPAPVAAMMGASVGFPRIHRQSGQLTLLARD